MPSAAPARPAQVPAAPTAGFRNTGLPNADLRNARLQTAFLVLTLLAIPLAASASNKNTRRGTCVTTYTVIQQDDLGNVQQGISRPENRKWTDKDLWKRYPDVCYVDDGPSAKAVFLITAYEYGKFILTLETFAPDGKPVVQRTFQQDGIYRATYRAMYSLPLTGQTHHPAKDLIADAVKWIHDGGLDDIP